MDTDLTTALCSSIGCSEGLSQTSSEHPAVTSGENEILAEQAISHPTKRSTTKIRNEPVRSNFPPTIRTSMR
jgi:hypothetical protein